MIQKKLRIGYKVFYMDGHEQYLENLLDTIQSIASGDFSSRIHDQCSDEILNVIGLGINMLGEEIEKIFVNQQKIQDELKEKNDLLIQSEEEINSMNEELRLSNEELISKNDELVQSQKDLADLNRTLEDKVEERTEKIERLLHQKDEFIIQLGHDLKSPLSPIITLMPIIKKKIDDPNLSEILDVVNTSVNRLKVLMDKLLKLVLLNAPSTNLSIETIDIVSEIQSILTIHQTTLHEKEIHFENRLKGELLCDVDKVYFGELIENLISNAIKYAGFKERRIVLDYSYDDRYITLSFSDNGIGLSENQMKQIFDDFFKVDGSRHDLNSHGLGLSICKRIVEKQHGKIWAESSGINKGTTFFISLPWKQTPLIQEF